jgi:aminoglycoside phosphotransferase (APT) family kinase protein
VALSEAQRAGLAAWLAPVLAADRVSVVGAERLGGGAIQENVALDVLVDGGARAGRHALVLRRDAPSGVPESRTRLEEHALLEVAQRAGVRVPEPWAACADPAVIGGPFYLMGRVAGEARGIRLVRDPTALAAGDALVAEVAGELAKLHRVTPEAAALPFLSAPRGPILPARIADLRHALDALGEAQPVLEWGLRRLELTGPRTADARLVHADCRTGNFLVEGGRLQAILDWEFARLSEPLEDLGWMLARCWRFGVLDRHAGGLGSRAAFLGAYEAAAGAAVDRHAVVAWELLATIRWAVIALQQAARHDDGGEPSLELALTGHVVPTLERDVLDYVEAIERGEAI